jgi:hypothetical protein
MQDINITEITEKLQKLPPDKLEVVYDFISYLLDREMVQTKTEPTSEAFQTMLASETVLRKDWERTEEDEAWANL